MKKRLITEEEKRKKMVGRFTMKRKLVHPSKIFLNIIFIFLILFGILATLLPYEEIPEKEIPCYDKYNNKIQGVTCIQEKSYGPSIFVPLVFIFMVFYVFLGGILKIILEEPGKSNWLGFERKRNTI